ncbi:MAG: hypothetical protein JJU45_09415 [Acidimicrobiia bacterium]|nr:hypothetical protein [Acidimicrobiia bacterium]
MTAVTSPPLVPPGAPEAPRRRRWLVVVAIVVAVAAVVGGVVTLLVVFSEDGARRAPVTLDEATEPEGLAAFVALLSAFGAGVERDTLPLDDDVDAVLLLPSIHLDEEEVTLLDEWQAASPDRLVVGTGSQLIGSSARADVGPLGDRVTLPDGRTGVELDRGPCGVRAFGDVADLVVRPSDPAIGPRGGQPAEVCFGDDARGFVVVPAVDPTSDVVGPQVWLGGVSPFTNGLLAEADNAVLATTLFAPVPGRRVVLLETRLTGLPRVVDGVVQSDAPDGSGSPATPPSFEEVDREDEPSLGDLIPVGARLAVVQLLIAAVLYVWWKARRFGAPVEDPPAVEIEGSELVGAVAGLLQRTGSVDRAAELLVGATRAELSTALDLGADAPASVVAEAAARRSVRTAEELGMLLGSPSVSDDEGLVRLARELDSIRSEVLDGVAP